MTETKLNKRLYTDISRLKLLDKKDEFIRFRLCQSPFPDDDALKVAENLSEFIITGQIFPNSNIYKERSYMIEIKLTKTFPIDPPQVRFLTNIYHPNVDKNGQICNDLLHKTAKWTPTTSLVQVVEMIVNYIDQPDIDNSINSEIGKEYKENRKEFDRKALKFVEEYGLPR